MHNFPPRLSCYLKLPGSTPITEYARIARCIPFWARKKLPLLEDFTNEILSADNILD